LPRDLDESWSTSMPARTAKATTAGSRLPPLSASPPGCATPTRPMPMGSVSRSRAWMAVRDPSNSTGPPCRVWVLQTSGRSSSLPGSASKATARLRSSRHSRPPIRQTKSSSCRARAGTGCRSSRPPPSCRRPGKSSAPAVAAESSSQQALACRLPRSPAPSRVGEPQCLRPSPPRAHRIGSLLCVLPLPVPSCSSRCSIAAASI
jgi:hypothetical protein